MVRIGWLSVHFEAVAMACIIPALACLLFAFASIADMRLLDCGGRPAAAISGGA